VAKQVIETSDGAPPAGAYSQGWRAGDFIFVTGTGPGGSDGEIVGETIEEQTGRTIENIEAVLRAGGATLADVVKMTVHLADTSMFERYDAAYRSRFSEPFPVRTTVGSDLGHSPGMLIEMDCIAYVGS
jgi:2-iminobutanoate/2-iminopropanoate deaminase